MKKQTKKPIPVMLSKRANVLFLEYCRVCKQDERVVYLTKTGCDVESYFNIPEKNTAFLMLGNGTSITQAAVRMLADSHVIVGFCGSGGSPPYGQVDCAFLNMECEYRPTSYMQSWAKMWFSEEHRLDVAKSFCLKRIELTIKFWLKLYNAVIPEKLATHFQKEISQSDSTNKLLLAEANWARGLYRFWSDKFTLKGFTRRKNGENNEVTGSISKINDLLDQGNYIAYGYAATALSGMGLSFMFPVLHGKTRRGALVFDLADLFKDAIVLPLAFTLGSKRASNKEFRDELIEVCFDVRVLDILFGFVKSTCEKV